MAKSSSSHRKKRYKISSKARTKKSKSKSEKYKSKKVRRRSDSFSDSLSSDSVSSSGDDRRSRRARSRTRRDAKGSKKRSRKRSYTSDSSEESPQYEVKKRSRSNARASSEIESKRYRGRSEIRMREDNGKNKVESGTERSRYRSRSHSLRRDYSESEERVISEGNGRRLRSVIAVPIEDNEGRWLDEGGQKEEIMYDHDDYPSCKSNDSNDGGIKRESGNHLQVASEVRMREESAKEEEALASDAEIMHLSSNGNICDRDGGSRAEGINSSLDGTKITDHLYGNNTSEEISSLKDEDLETVLRQKAIENLKRFRGKPKEIAVTDDKNGKEQPSGSKAESAQIESPKVGGARIVVVKSSKENISENEQTRVVEETYGSPARDSIRSSETFETELVKKNVRDETGSAKQDARCPTQRGYVSGSSKMVSTTVVDKPNLAAPKITSGSLKPQSILKRALASLQPPQDRLLVTDSSVDNTASRTTKILTQSSNNDGLDICNGSGSTASETLGENRSDSQQEEAKDGSQFEQKTMSVMRGSEMVQVSYKVYIPKKAPALARRQLKR